MIDQDALNKIVRNLAFEVEAIPVKSADLVQPSKNAQLKIKIRVRKKDKKKRKNQKIISLTNLDTPDKNAPKTKLTHSEHTIMSFNISIDEDQKSLKKPRNNLLSSLKSGICLGSIEDEEEEPVNLPSSSHSTKLLKSEEKKSNEPLNQGLYLSKNYQVYSTTTPRKPTMFFGKCKPGGCLDPPANEDIYPYKPTKKDKITNEKYASEQTVASKIAPHQIIEDPAVENMKNDSSSGQDQRIQGRSSIFSRGIFKNKRKSIEESSNSGLKDTDPNLNQTNHQKNSISSIPSNSKNNSNEIIRLKEEDRSITSHSGFTDSYYRPKKRRSTANDDNVVLKRENISKDPTFVPISTPLPSGIPKTTSRKSSQKSSENIEFESDRLITISTPTIKEDEEKDTQEEPISVNQPIITALTRKATAEKLITKTKKSSIADVIKVTENTPEPIKTHTAPYSMKNNKTDKNAESMVIHDVTSISLKPNLKEKDIKVSSTLDVEKSQGQIEVHDKSNIEITQSLESIFLHPSVNGKDIANSKKSNISEIDTIQNKIEHAHESNLLKTPIIQTISSVDSTKQKDLLCTEPNDVTSRKEEFTLEKPPNKRTEQKTLTPKQLGNVIEKDSLQKLPNTQDIFMKTQIHNEIVEDTSQKFSNIQEVLIAKPLDSKTDEISSQKSPYKQKISIQQQLDIEMDEDTDEVSSQKLLEKQEPFIPKQLASEVDKNTLHKSHNEQETLLKKRLDSDGKTSQKLPSKPEPLSQKQLNSAKVEDTSTRFPKKQELLIEKQFDIGIAEDRDEISSQKLTDIQDTFIQKQLSNNIEEESSQKYSHKQDTLSQKYLDKETGKDILQKIPKKQEILIRHQLDIELDEDTDEVTSQKLPVIQDNFIQKQLRSEKDKEFSQKKSKEQETLNLKHLNSEIKEKTSQKIPNKQYLDLIEIDKDTNAEGLQNSPDTKEIVTPIRSQSAIDEKTSLKIPKIQETLIANQLSSEKDEDTFTRFPNAQETLIRPQLDIQKDKDTEVISQKSPVTQEIFTEKLGSAIDKDFSQEHPNKQEILRLHSDLDEKINEDEIMTQQQLRNEKDENTSQQLPHNQEVLVPPQLDIQKDKDTEVSSQKLPDKHESYNKKQLISEIHEVSSPQLPSKQEILIQKQLDIEINENTSQKTPNERDILILGNSSSEKVEYTSQKFPNKQEIPIQQHLGIGIDEVTDDVSSQRLPDKQQTLIQKQLVNELNQDASQKLPNRQEIFIRQQLDIEIDVDRDEVSLQKLPDLHKTSIEKLSGREVDKESLQKLSSKQEIFIQKQLGDEIDEEFLQNNPNNQEIEKRSQQQVDMDVDQDTNEDRSQKTLDIQKATRSAIMKDAPQKLPNKQEIFIRQELEIEIDVDRDEVSLQKLPDLHKTSIEKLSGREVDKESLQKLSSKQEIFIQKQLGDEIDEEFLQNNPNNQEIEKRSQQQVDMDVDQDTNEDRSQKTLDIQKATRSVIMKDAPQKLPNKQEIFIRQELEIEIDEDTGEVSSQKLLNTQETLIPKHLSREIDDKSLQKPSSKQEILIQKQFDNETHENILQKLSSTQDSLSQNQLRSVEDKDISQEISNKLDILSQQHLSIEIDERKGDVRSQKLSDMQDTLVQKHLGSEINEDTLQQFPGKEDVMIHKQLDIEISEENSQNYLNKQETLSQNQLNGEKDEDTSQKIPDSQEILGQQLGVKDDINDENLQQFPDRPHSRVIREEIQSKISKDTYERIPDKFRNSFELQSINELDSDLLPAVTEEKIETSDHKEEILPETIPESRRMSSFINEHVKVKSTRTYSDTDKVDRLSVFSLKSKGQSFISKRPEIKENVSEFLNKTYYGDNLMETKIRKESSTKVVPTPQSQDLSKFPNIEMGYKIVSNNLNNLQDDVSQDTISADLAFYSYKNNKNMRKIITCDPHVKANQPETDGRMIVKSQKFKLNSSEIKLSIDSKHEMCIQLKKIITDQATKTEAISDKTKGRPINTKDGLVLSSSNQMVQFSHEKNIATVCEKELISLHSLIKNVKREIDRLAYRQALINEKLLETRKIKKPVLSSKKCGCQKRTI